MCSCMAGYDREPLQMHRLSLYPRRFCIVLKSTHAFIPKRINS